MTKIKDMTDAKLVEAVAREVLGFRGHLNIDDHFVYSVQDEEGYIRRLFDPFTDLNDLFMVLEKFDGWNISKDWEFGYTCAIWQSGRQFSVTAKKDLASAVQEAALQAKRSEK